MNLEWRHKGHDRLCIGIPGWGFDGHFFDEWCTPDATWLLCHEYDPFTLVSELSDLLSQESWQSLRLFGFSMGGFLAAELGAQFADRVEDLTLMSVRRSYAKQDLDPVRDALDQHGLRYLSFFYDFTVGDHLPSKTSMTALRSKMRAFTIEELYRGLAYLERAQLNEESCKPFKRVVFLHGKKDLVAPAKEARDLALKCGAEYIEYPNNFHYISDLKTT